MLSLGVIGYGYWGPNLVRNFLATGRARIGMLADKRAEMLARAQNIYPGLDVTTDALDLIRNPKIDAVAIATPVSTHYPLAKVALEAGKHVLIEKPMATKADEAAELVELAAAKKLVLMVDHTFCYTPAVQKIRQAVESGALGDFYYYDSTRINLGLFQHDVNVIWDLAVHDLSILDFIYPERPHTISAQAVSHVPGAPEDIAFITLYYGSGAIAHINVSWISPVKQRMTLVGGSKSMIVYNDMEPTEKIKLYDRGFNPKEVAPERIYAAMMDYRTGDMHAPYLPNAEALRVEADHFIDCVEGKAQPLTGGKMGWRLVTLMQQADVSAAERGRPVPLKLA